MATLLRDMLYKYGPPPRQPPDSADSFIKAPENMYDHIVVGAGIQGSCTALNLAQQGRNVLLIEQFPLPHTRGSSHGPSRLIRTFYTEDFYAKMMPDAFGMWRSIEKLSGTPLIVTTGLLVFEKAPGARAVAGAKNVRQVSPEAIEELTEDDLKSRYPQFRYGKDYKVFLDKTGGIILAHKALTTIQELFKKTKGTLRDGCKVINIHPGSLITVTTSDGTFQSPSLIICAGPWTGHLLKPLGLHLPLEVKRVRVLYWKEKVPDTHSAKKGFPGFIDKTNDMYGVPGLEYPEYVKICPDGGAECDPDHREKAKRYEDAVAAAAKAIREHFPGLESTVGIEEVCMYTMTPDEVCILDRHPRFSNIIIGAGFSGTGFKISPVVGKLLAQLALNHSTSHSVKPFALSRFNIGNKSRL